MNPDARFGVELVVGINAFALMLTTSLIRQNVHRIGHRSRESEKGNEQTKTGLKLVFRLTLLVVPRAPSRLESLS